MTGDEKKDSVEEKLAKAAPPPVDFRLFLEGFVGQALVAMGKLPHPVTNETRVDLPWARYFIDLLDLLKKKTKGNLDAAEERVFEQQLTMLRLTFVEVQEKHGGATRGSAENAGPEN